MNSFTMSAQPIVPVKVFISYSWTTSTHENWVYELATRLDTYQEFSITLDKWTLETGHDVNAFMEQMAAENNLIDKVIVVSDKGYTEKANRRERGVGRESQIISEEVYREINQTKFIPLVRERDDLGEPYLPVFLRSRKFIDFSDDSQYEDKFEELCRDLISKPKYTRPAKTERLNADFDDEKSPTSKTSQLLKGIDSVISTRAQLLPLKIQDFLNAFYEELGQFSFEVTDSSELALGQQIVDQITAYRPLRDTFLSFFDKITRAGQPFEIDLLIRFFGRIYSYAHPANSSIRYQMEQFHQYRFIIYELFLSTVGLFLKNEQFTYVEELLYSTYDVQGDYAERDPQPYRIFYLPFSSIDAYYQQFKGRQLYSATMTLLLDRASELVPRNYLVEADLICYHLSEINEINRTGSLLDGRWFPLTYIYQDREPLPFFKRLTSRKYFEKVKGIYGVSSPSELANKLEDYKRKCNGRPQVNTEMGVVLPLYTLVNPMTIGRDR